MFAMWLCFAAAFVVLHCTWTTAEDRCQLIVRDRRAVCTLAALFAERQVLQDVLEVEMRNTLPDIRTLFTPAVLAKCREIYPFAVDLIYTSRECHQKPATIGHFTSVNCIAIPDLIYDDIRVSQKNIK